jgi:hypothetical protein
MVKVYLVRLADPMDGVSECVFSDANRLHRFLVENNRDKTIQFDLEEIRNMLPCNSTNLDDETFLTSLPEDEEEEISSPSRITKGSQPGNILQIEITCFWLDSAENPVWAYCNQ